MKRLLGSATAVLLGAALLVGAQQTAAAAVSYAGPCTGGDALTGVTVVIDFQGLNPGDTTGATNIVRCSPDATPSTPRTGLQALQDSGLALEGVARWGLGFICRIEGRPSATESIPINGNPSYKERCVDTPPAAAYWSYWHADGSGHSWTYSNYGVMNRNVVPGGFEGWSFSLNATAGTNPQPRHDPHNPLADPTAATVSLSADDLDRTIALGQSETVRWTSTNAVSLTAESVSPVTGGGAWSGPLPGPNGSKTLTPTRAGAYTYTIAATDSRARTVRSTVTLTVTGGGAGNSAPVAQDVAVSTAQGQPVQVGLSASDPDGDALTFTTSQPGHGSLSGTGALRSYTPQAGFTGTDSFQFTVSDDEGGSDTGRVTVTVTEPGLPPASLRVAAPRGYQLRGNRIAVTTAGLADEEPYSIRIGGRLATSGVAASAGAFTRSVTIPAALPEGAHQVVVVGGSAERHGAVALRVLAPKTLGVSVAKQRVRPGQKQRITVRRLAAGEQVSIMVAGRKLTGRADGRGVLVRRTTVRKPFAKVRVVVRGEYGVRRGQASFRVVRQ